MLKLIIVEDEKAMLLQLKKIIELENIGFEIVGMFTNGLEAKNYISEYSVDCILSDIKLPYITGIQLAEYCCNEHSDIKVCLISAYRDFEYAKKAIQYNVINYITKPIVYSEFKLAMEKLYNAATETQKKNSIEAEEKDEKYDNAAIQSAVEYIEKNISKKILLYDVALYAAMNADYFSKMFTKVTGHIFTDYVMDKKIEYAKKLLSETNYKINLIAQKTGYSDPQYFYKVFKKKTGVTPNEYRNGEKD